jgi:hypothetical protein
MLNVRTKIDELLNSVFHRNNRAATHGEVVCAPEPRVQARKASLGNVNLQQTAASVVSLYNQAPVLASTAQRMDSHAREQAETMAQIVKDTDEITTALNSVVNELDTSSKDAFSSVKLIKEITEGARILAINASIEAARAGQVGLPFNVVAIEMQRLARQTEEASEHLAGTLMNMRNKVHDVVRVVGNSEDTATPTANDTSSVATLTRAFHEIDTRAREQQKEAHGVNEMAEQTRAISEGLLMDVGKMRFDIHFKSEGVVEQLVLQPALASGNRDSIEPLLIDALKQFPFFDLFYVTDAQGRQITRNVGHDHRNPQDGLDALGKDWSERPWYQNAFEYEGPYTTDLYLSVATQRFCFTVSEAILDEEGVVVGILGADVDFERLLMLRRFENRPRVRRAEISSPLELASTAV